MRRERRVARFRLPGLGSCACFLSMPGGPGRPCSRPLAVPAGSGVGEETRTDGCERSVTCHQNPSLLERSAPLYSLRPNHKQKSVEETRAWRNSMKSSHVATGEGFLGRTTWASSVCLPPPRDSGRACRFPRQVGGDAERRGGCYQERGGQGGHREWAAEKAAGGANLEQAGRGFCLLLPQ